MKLNGELVKEGQPMSLTILVADDLEENLELLTDIFTEQNYCVLAAREGNEALSLLQNNTVHLIVADAMMPKMDGFQLCKKIRSNQRTSKIPFVMYSGSYIDEEDQQLARNIGVNRYLMKSGSLNELLDAVNELAVNCYGESAISEHAADTTDEQKFIEHHHTIVTKKLEEKMAELQRTAEKLTLKNKELIESELRYKNLFEYARLPIVVLNIKSGKIIDVNVQAAAMLGFQRSEMLENFSLPFAESVTAEQLSDLQAADIPMETSMRTKDGAIIFVEVTAGPITFFYSTELLVFMRDITEQKKMRENLIQVEKMSLMGKLAAGIAHEIRNPLAGLAMNLLFLQRRISEQTPERESVDAAIEGSHRIKHIIEDTLNLARVTPPHLRDEFINEIIRRSLAFISAPLQHKNITVNAQYESSLPRVEVDFKQIQQVLLNLIQNSIDASPEHSTIYVSTSIVTAENTGAEQPPPYVQILVTDEGVGIPKDMWQHLFEPFHTTKATGTGLGLMLTKYIIERHQGKISIEPGVEKGTTVKILLPQFIITEG